MSFTAESSLNTKGFSFFPTAFSLDGWRYVMKYGNQVLQSYKITLYEVFVGTSITLLFTSMFAYALSRRDWVLRGFLSIFLLITMLFHGGMVAGYIINTSIYHLKNNLLILVLPGAVSTYNCIVMRTFIQSNVPDSLIEAARIDGLNEFQIFIRMFIPMMKPTYASAATITFMGAWNAYLWPKVVMQTNEAITMPMLVANTMGGYVIDYGVVMAAVTICSLPTVIIFFCLQKSFTNAVAGAVK